MLYRFILCSFTLISFFVNVFFLFCNLLIPITLLFLLVTLATSKFIKLREPNAKIVDKFFKFGKNEELEYPIANKGGIFDVPENSVAALRQCVTKQCHNILVDLNVTKCNQLVALNKSTLEKAGLKNPISDLTLDELKSLNIAEHHPLGVQFQPETVLTLDVLLKLAEELDLKLFCLTTNVSCQMLDALRKRVDETFVRRCVLCTSSPFTIYQLRKQFSDLVCGLWMNKPMVTKSSLLFRTSAILKAIYMAVVRNIVAPVIGIKVVFLHKDEFNAHVQTLWSSVGVRSVVYTVNSPNEKRYFQQVIKSQYLTDSLRSEPQIIFAAKKI